MARKNKLEATVARIQARFGTRALTRGRAPAVIGPAYGRQTASNCSNAANCGQFEQFAAVRGLSVPHIPTGYPELDALLGIGGLPKGKVCEIVGQPTSGKTTLTLRFLAQAQAHGPVAYLDQARFFDADYACRLSPVGRGLDLSRLLVGRPYDLTECLSTAEALAQSETLAALVIDASESLWMDIETSRQMGAFLNRMISPLSHSGLVLLVVHDGEPREVRGSPLAHHAALRLGVRREKWLKKHGDVCGCQARVEVLKNRGPTAVGTGRSASIAIELGGATPGAELPPGPVPGP